MAHVLLPSLVKLHFPDRIGRVTSIYTTALAYKGKGDAAKAKEFAGRAANFNVLPLLTYAFVRAEARSWPAAS